MNLNIPYSPSRLDATLFLNREFKKILVGKNNIIDIGCGKLYLHEILKDLKRKGNYLGIDIEAPKIKPDIKGFKIKILRKDFLKYKTKQKFNIATCLWVLEHIKKDKEAINKISQILQKNGTLVLAVPSVYSWPFEFGRHGFHYYARDNILNLLQNNDFKIVKTYSASGFLGFLFMIFYNWPRYFVLVPTLVTYSILNKMGFVKSSWQGFSHKVISSIFYSYHKTKRGLRVHNLIVSSIVMLDNRYKFFPASYIIIATKR